MRVLHLGHYIAIPILTRMMADLKQMQDAIRSQHNAELEALRAENDQLHQLLADRDRERVEAVASTPANDRPEADLRAEVDSHLVPPVSA